MTTRIMRTAAVCILTALATACGSSSSSSPTTPSTTTLTSTNVFAAPTAFLQSGQQINEADNKLTFTWTGSASTYQFVVGNAPGVIQQTFQVTGNTYTWTSPQTGGAYYARVAPTQNGTVGNYSDELSLFVLDIRNVIDALFFHAGPMADVPSTALSNPRASVWADGTALTVLVESQATETARANAQTFANDYAALVSNKVTATATLSGSSFSAFDSPDQIATNTILVRIKAGFCTSGALGCAFYGPLANGSGQSVVTLAASSGLYLSATGHEMGHAYGFGHVTKPAAGRPEFRFMMNPSYTNEQMTDVEKLAITVARTRGIRPGMFRSDALALNLVNPYTGTSNVLGARGAFSERRDAGGWILVGLMRPSLLLHDGFDVGDLHRQCLR